MAIPISGQQDQQVRIAALKTDNTNDLNKLLKNDDKPKAGSGLQTESKNKAGNEGDNTKKIAFESLGKNLLPSLTGIDIKAEESTNKGKFQKFKADDLGVSTKTTIAKPESKEKALTKSGLTENTGSESKGAADVVANEARKITQAQDAVALAKYFQSGDGQNKVAQTSEARA